MCHHLSSLPPNVVLTVVSGLTLFSRVNRIRTLVLAAAETLLSCCICVIYVYSYVRVYTVCPKKMQPYAFHDNS